MSDYRSAKKQIDVSVGEPVRIIRKLQGMSQNDVAKLSGIPQSTISAIENDRINLGVERAKTLVEHLQPGSVGPYVQRVSETVIPAIRGLSNTFRESRWPIFFTELASRTADGSDLPLWAQRINGLALTAIEKVAYPQFDGSSASIISAVLPNKSFKADALNGAAQLKRCPAENT